MNVECPPSRKKNSRKTDDRLLSDSLEALVDSSVPGKVEHFEIAVRCVWYIWCNWYLGSKGHTVPWRALDATFGPAAAFNAVSGRVRKYLAFTVFPSCNQSFVPARAQDFIFLSISSTIYKLLGNGVSMSRLLTERGKRCGEACSCFFFFSFFL